MGASKSKQNTPAVFWDPFFFGPDLLMKDQLANPENSKKPTPQLVEPPESRT